MLILTASLYLALRILVIETSERTENLTTHTFIKVSYSDLLKMSPLIVESFIL